MSRFVTKWVLGISLLSVLAGCDPAYSVFVRNGMPTPIEISANFEGEPTRQATLGPGQRMAFFHVKGDLQNLVVVAQQRPLYALDKAGILELMARVDDPNSVVWIVSESGIRPLSPVEDSRLQKAGSDWGKR